MTTRSLAVQRLIVKNLRAHFDEVSRNPHSGHTRTHAAYVEWYEEREKLRAMERQAGSLIGR